CLFGKHPPWPAMWILFISRGSTSSVCEALLDLGHLTEVEQTMILNVLLRDAELQQQEEGRISKLQQVESDPVRLRSLTGAWFNEERAKRHHSRGADIIHASIRHKRRSKDLPVSSAFEEKKEENSERQEESTVENTEDLEDTGIAEHGIETGEEKSERLEDLFVSGSLMSLYSVGDFGGITITGRIQFSLQYDTKREELCVRVCRCQNLAPARNSHSDPYVKVYLLPDNTSRSKRKTSVKRKTLNPIYDETLKYKVRQSDLQARVLSVSVWHMERVRRNLFLGEVEVGLAQWDWGRSQPIWYPLMPRVQMNPDAILSRGTILLSLKFIPPGSEEGGYPLTGELHIWLKEIVGLIPPKRGSPSTYVKSVVLPDESGISGQQTRVVRGSVSPLFNHTMVYDGLQLSDLTQACTEITVWNSSACLGGVRLSMGSGVSYGQMVCWMDSTEEEISVWNTVIKNSNAWVDTALPIRTNLRLCSE
uniref:Synaptotagmin-like protein 1 n=1 Tax=Electrophorus electricus TaxID=8005 RepID=A0A4W4FVU0_ELEEL